MYRRPKFLEVLIAIREEMAAESDYDVELLAQRARVTAHSSSDEHASGGTSLTFDGIPPDHDPLFTEIMENLQ